MGEQDNLECCIWQCSTPVLYCDMKLDQISSSTWLFKVTDIIHLNLQVICGHLSLPEHAAPDVLCIARNCMQKLKGDVADDVAEHKHLAEVVAVREGVVQIAT